MDNPLERRCKSVERRNSIQSGQFPVITRHGVCVRSDRRKYPDRRISNIQVGENVIGEDAFDILFSRFTVDKKLSA